ncbi:MAG: C_GCAxxG_C_C family protein [Dehalococcoidia bacterium]|nr:MAG: C_GCAxxG_C_C family protein [Dehalococcoidia bacterium]UCG82248.1 MAG: C_GCAxxG_C_C family protein [Dehalococcoidia bacterium]
MSAQNSREALKEQVRKKAYDYAREYHGCSQAIMVAFQEPLGLDAMALRAASTLVGGLGMGKTCGALAGGAMVLGLKYGRSSMEEGLPGLIPGMLHTQPLVKRFEDEFGTTGCFEIAGIDWLNFEEAAEAISDPEFLQKCAEIVGRTAEMVADIVFEQD